jgi:hypothetical protein
VYEELCSRLFATYHQHNFIDSHCVTPQTDVHGSVHHKYIPIYIQQDATLHRLFISGNCSTRFGCYFHPSSGTHTTVSTASGIYHTVTAICRYRGGVGTVVLEYHRQTSQSDPISDRAIAIFMFYVI